MKAIFPCVKDIPVYEGYHPVYEGYLPVYEGYLPVYEGYLPVYEYHPVNKGYPRV